MASGSSSLASLSDPALVAQTVALALEVREQPGLPMLKMLISALRPRSLLLVLDNCEHLLDRLLGASRRAAARLHSPARPRDEPGVARDLGRDQLQGAVPVSARRQKLPPVASLASTRRSASSSIGRWGPAVVRRDRPERRGGRPDLLPTGRYPARDRARRRASARPGVEQLAARLDDRFRLLTGGSRTALRRQQTLRAAIDWSHDLLSPEEKVLFRRLAAFSGGWTLEAVEAVCAGGEVAGGEVAGGEVVDLLLRLVDRSLVEVDTIDSRRATACPRRSGSTLRRSCSSRPRAARSGTGTWNTTWGWPNWWRSQCSSRSYANFCCPGGSGARQPASGAGLEPREG